MSAWSNEETFQFLELYRLEPAIWNPKHAAHKNKNTVNDAWTRIEDEMGIPVIELKKKKESLMTAFRSHHKKKMLSMRCGAGEDVYKPIWIFYDVMEHFLKDIYDCKSSTYSDEVSIVSFEGDSTQMDLENGDYFVLSSNEEAKVSKSESTPDLPVTKRRLKNPLQLGEGNSRINRAFTALNDKLNIDKEDECELYGKLIAKKLRQFSDEERDELMYEIDGMILKRKRVANQFNVLNIQSPSTSVFPTRANSSSSSSTNMDSNYIEPTTILTTAQDHVYTKSESTEETLSDSNQ